MLGSKTPLDNTNMLIVNGTGAYIQQMLSDRSLSLQRAIALNNAGQILALVNDASGVLHVMLLTPAR